MKRIVLIYIFLIGSLLSFAGRGNDSVAVCDSIMREVEHLPADTSRLSRLLEITRLHQYPPYNLYFSKQLYEEAVEQHNLFYKNMGAYYIATCYDKKHDLDTLIYWVDKLKELAPKIGNYDYYLEQKAAISRVFSSKQMVEKAVYTAKEVLEESEQRKSYNGAVAAYNSLGCAYAVSNRVEEGIQVLLKGYKLCRPSTKLSLRLDILSRLGGNYGNLNKRDSLAFYLTKMNKLLQNAITREPETMNNWRDVLVDCQTKFVRYYINRSDYSQAAVYLDKAKELLTGSVDLVYWVNVQLVELQFLTRTKEYDKSIALIDEVAPIVEKDYVSTFTVLIYYKALTQRDKGDMEGALVTLKYLLHKQDSLNLAFTTSQLEQVKELYHIDELLMQKQKIKNTNYTRAITILVILLVLMAIFYIYTKILSRKIAQAEKAAAEAAALSNADNIAKERLKLEISHDIRTPLNAVVGFAEILAEADCLDEESKVTYNKIIQENANQLLEYVNNVLELSRLESGKIKYKEEKVELISKLREVISTSNAMLDNHVTTTLHTKMEKVWIHTDIERLMVCLNSFTFSAMEGEEHQTIITIKKLDAKPFLLIKIVDTPLAKERFENKTAMLRNEINAHFIHHFGGYYKVDEQAEQGPTVTFTYPLV